MTLILLEKPLGRQNWTFCAQSDLIAAIRLCIAIRAKLTIRPDYKEATMALTIITIGVAVTAALGGLLLKRARRQPTFDVKLLVKQIGANWEVHIRFIEEARLGTFVQDPDEPGKWFFRSAGQLEDGPAYDYPPFGKALRDMLGGVSYHASPGGRQLEVLEIRGVPQKMAKQIRALP